MVADESVKIEEFKKVQESMEEFHRNCHTRLEEQTVSNNYYFLSLIIGYY